MISPLFFLGCLICHSHFDLLVNVAEVDDFCHSGNRPGEDVQQIQGQDRVEIREHRVHPNDTEHAGTKDHDDGRHHALAQATGTCNGAVHKGAESVGETHHPKANHAGIHDRFIRGEECQETLAEEFQCQTND